MKKTNKKNVSIEDLLKDILIVQLGLAKIGQPQIREIVKVDINRVNRIIKCIRKSEKNNAK